jgi:hypothetical protein
MSVEAISASDRNRTRGIIMATVKTLTRTVVASLFLVAVAACSTVPAPQVASTDAAAQNQDVFAGN